MDKNQLQGGENQEENQVQVQHCQEIRTLALRISKTLDIDQAVGRPGNSRLTPQLSALL